MSNEAKVGSFVIIAITIFVITFLYVANVQLQGGKVTYRTYFEYAGGLDPGTAVRYAGLKAGAVDNVRPWSENPTRVEVIISMRDDVPVNTKSVAQISSLSALGQNYLEITAGDINAPRIEPGGVITSEEAVTLNHVTKQISSLADQMDGTIEDVARDFHLIAEDAQVLLVNLQELTGEENRKHVESLLANSSGMIEEQRPKIDRITTQLSDALEKVDGLVVDLREVAQNANTTVKTLDATIEDARGPLKRDLEELEKTLIETRALIEDIQAVVVVNEDNISNMLANFERASRDVEALASELRQRPWSLIRVKPKPGRAVPVAAQ